MFFLFWEIPSHLERTKRYIIALFNVMLDKDSSLNGVERYCGKWKSAKCIPSLVHCIVQRTGNILFGGGRVFNACYPLSLVEWSLVTCNDSDLFSWCNMWTAYLRFSCIFVHVCFQGECSDQNFNLPFRSMLDSWEFTRAD